MTNRRGCALAASVCPPAWRGCRLCWSLASFTVAALLPTHPVPACLPFIPNPKVLHVRTALTFTAISTCRICAASHPITNPASHLAPPAHPPSTLPLHRSPSPLHPIKRAALPSSQTHRPPFKPKPSTLFKPSIGFALTSIPVSVSLLPAFFSGAAKPFYPPLPATTLARGGRSV